MATQERKVLSIQCLRAIAAILVVFCHSEQFTSAFMPVHMVKYLGQCFGNFGVDIFFVISGFIMVYISRDYFQQKGASFSFLKRRFSRIFPIYWLITLTVFFILIPVGLYDLAFQNSPATNANEMKGGYYFFKSMLLIPYFNAAGNSVSPIISVAWTLIYEMFFYYVFSLLLFFNRKLYLYLLTTIFASVIVAQCIINKSFLHLAINPSFNLYLTVYGNNIILEFIFGCFIAELYLKGKVLSNKLSILAILFSVFSFIYIYHIPQLHYYQLHGFALLTLFYHVKALGTGIPAMLLVYGMLSLETNNSIKIPVFLVKLGNASYSIYLTHFSISLVLFLSLFKKMGAYIYIPGDLAVFSVWILCIIFGCITYKYIELPLIKLLRNFSFKKIIILISRKNMSSHGDAAA